MTSDKVRSSNAATSCASRLIVSERRTVTSLIFFSSMIQPKKYRNRQDGRAGLQRTPKRRRETPGEIPAMSGGIFRGPEAGAYLFGDGFGQGIGRVWVDVWSQVVRGHSIAEIVGNGQHDIGRRHLDLDLIKPSPDMHLPNLRPGHTLTDTACQIDLATGQIDSF